MSDEKKKALFVLYSISDSSNMTDRYPETYGFLQDSHWVRITDEQGKLVSMYGTAYVIRVFLGEYP